MQHRGRTTPMHEAWYKAFGDEVMVLRAWAFPACVLPRLGPPGANQGHQGKVLAAGDERGGGVKVPRPRPCRPPCSARAPKSRLYEFDQREIN